MWSAVHAASTWEARAGRAFSSLISLRTVKQAKARAPLLIFTSFDKSRKSRGVSRRRLASSQCFTFTFCGFLLQSAAPMQNVLTYLSENEPRFVRELCDYLRFPSVSAQSHHRSEVEAAARWLVEHCQSIGLEARLCPTDGNPVVVAQTPRPTSASSSRRAGRPHFLVYGHYDVQPAEPFDLWKSPPLDRKSTRLNSSHGYISYAVFCL